MPNKPITLIVPFAAGGNLDIIGRLIAPGLAKQLGQSVVVQNKPGAGGVLGATELSRSEADGTVLLVSTPNAIYITIKTGNALRKTSTTFTNLYKNNCL